ncbi:class I SAM-dependent methyltransferase, partial [Peptostreptococcaceae bacterium OttesenSCG-928-C18]|nr:class I SAM-dependent methyltransferase [Peptostreptococcaceae bacterium OttesenSCG-928-C18]
YYINKFYNKDIVAVDMTVGNGNDLYNIAKVVNKESELFGFDIADTAIENSKIKLNEFKDFNITLVLDNHISIRKHIKDNIDLAIYNLGFLPGGNKKITTNYLDVIKSLEVLLKQLNPEGLIIITFYPGHESGLEESVKVEEYLKTLNQKEYNILKYDFINQINNPPYVVILERGNLE